jgi:hypothetical protein
MSIELTIISPHLLHIHSYVPENKAIPVFEEAVFGTRNLSIYWS